MPRILVLTASIGEGHNTAARGIREALMTETNGTAEVLVADPYTRTNPLVNKLVQQSYALAINRYPGAWKVVFEMLSRKGVVEGMEKNMLTTLKNAVRDLISEFRPDIMVSTYPIFSFLIAAMRRKDSAFTIPFFTVITDSTAINSVWYRCLSDGFLVADELTAKVMTDDGVDPALVHVPGFPVGEAFENIKPSPQPMSDPWKAIFFPGGKSSTSADVLRALAEVENLEVTVVTGKRRSMHDVLKNARLPVRGQLLGWTDDMPGLMGSHHFFIGKAGGATVQEAIASQLPFLVSHVVPCQEEGNISLIEQSGIGTLATGHPERPRDLIRGALANDAALWKTWRSNLAAMRKPGAARAIARFLLQKAGKS